MEFQREPSDSLPVFLMRIHIFSYPISKKRMSWTSQAFVAESLFLIGTNMLCIEGNARLQESSISSRFLKSKKL